MPKSKYKYDYPSQRELGKYLTSQDRQWIAMYSGLSENYVYMIFVKGNRTNRNAIKLAEIIKDQKQERDRIAKLSAK